MAGNGQAALGKLTPMDIYREYTLSESDDIYWSGLTADLASYFTSRLGGTQHDGGYVNIDAVDAYKTVYSVSGTAGWLVNVVSNQPPTTGAVITLKLTLDNAEPVEITTRNFNSANRGQRAIWGAVASSNGLVGALSVTDRRMASGYNYMVSPQWIQAIGGNGMLKFNDSLTVELKSTARYASTPNDYAGAYAILED